MGDQEKTDQGYGARATVIADVDSFHERRSVLLVRFWKGGRLSLADMDELTRLYAANTKHIWEMTANNDKET